MPPTLRPSALLLFRSALRLRLQVPLTRRWYPATPPPDGGLNVGHSEFLYQGGGRKEYNPKQEGSSWEGKSDAELKAEKDPWVGKLSPTSSHLFKLLLPLPSSLSPSSSSSSSSSSQAPPNPTAYLLHPSQPLSHLSRLILGSLPPSERGASIEFRAISVGDHFAYPTTKTSESPAEDEEGEEEGGPLLFERTKDGPEEQEVRWSPSTDLGDFIKQATLSQSFRIVIIPPLSSPSPSPSSSSPSTSSSSSSKPPKIKYDESDTHSLPPLLDHATHARQPEERQEPSPRAEDLTDGELSLTIMIPSFESRTVYLRRRLRYLGGEIGRMTGIKKDLDHEANKGARRYALSGLLGLVTYWGVVCKLTFFSSWGWDVMEPVTYLSGLTTVIGGYLFFLYHNREVSYSSILDLSISAKQQSLYTARGLDVELWTEMVAEAKTLRREMGRIADDYGRDWRGELGGEKKGGKTSGVPEAESGKGAGKRPAESRPQHGEGEGEKLDVDATIDEASELEAQTREKEGKRKHGGKGRGREMGEREERGREKGRRVVDEGM